MKCHQCPKPAMFMVGPDGNAIPLCLDCNSKFQEMLERQQINREREMNRLADEIGMSLGLPGFVPKYPPRVPLTVIQGATLNHINVTNSSIGVLNTGNIGTIDSAVGSMASSGDELSAEAFKAISERLINLGIDSETKNRVLELLSVLASEATVPKDKRRGIAMRPLIADLAALCGGISGLADVYKRFAPIIEGLFK